MNNRKKREKDFHNKAFSYHTRTKLSNFYKISKDSNRFYEGLLKKYSKGKKVLEYGCGPGTYSFSLAKNGADVVGIDISEVAIDQAQASAKEKGVEESTDFLVMDAEDLSFPDESFDVVCGRSIIHHLEVDKSFSEVSRVLKPSGKAIFLEPLGYNPFINLFRRMTPDLRTVDEHPLLKSDFNTAQKYFERAEIYYFDMSTLLSVPFLSTPISSFCIKILRFFDKLVFRFVPPARWLAWVAVFELSKPKRK